MGTLPEPFATPASSAIRNLSPAPLIPSVQPSALRSYPYELPRQFLASACWNLYISPGRDHWFTFIAILLMTPAVYLGNRSAA